MLMKAEILKGYKLHGTDGEIGRVRDFYFDDKHWTIRYLVADTGNWLTGRQVLISPYALRDVIKDTQDIYLSLTKAQIENSPPLDSDKPVSKQFEKSYYGYYGWPVYWSGAYMWGTYPDLVRDPAKWQESTQSRENWDLNLRSAHDVEGYHIQASDGEIGHVEDFLIDVATWAIRYLVVDTKNWWPGKKVLISPHWIERISWSDEKVFVNLSRELIRRSAEYKDDSPLSRDYESGLHRLYGRPGYWIDRPNATLR